MEIYRKDILVILDATPSIGYVFGSFVKVIHRDDKRFGFNEKRAFDMNERFISSMKLCSEFDVTNYSIIIKIMGNGDFFDMPDTRLRIDINSMMKGFLITEIRRNVNDADRPELKIFATTNETVKLFHVAAMTYGRPHGQSLLDNLFLDITGEQFKQIQKLKKDQKKVVQPKKKVSNVSSDDTSAMSGHKVLTDSDSAQLKTGVLNAPSTKLEVVAETLKYSETQNRKEKDDAKEGKDVIKPSTLKEEKEMKKQYQSTALWADMASFKEASVSRTSSRTTSDEMANLSSSTLCSSKTHELTPKSQRSSQKDTIDDSKTLDGKFRKGSQIPLVNVGSVSSNKKGMPQQMPFSPQQMAEVMFYMQQSNYEQGGVFSQPHNDDETQDSDDQASVGEKVGSDDEVIYAPDEIRSCEYDDNVGDTDYQTDSQ